MTAHPFDAAVGERVSGGALAELAAVAMADVRTLRATTRGTSTGWDGEHDFRIEVAHDRRDPAELRQRVLTVVDGEPVQDLVVIGDVAWAWRAGQDDYAVRPFVEAMLADPAPSPAELALTEDLETEVTFLGRAPVPCREGVVELWRFAVQDARPRDDDHTTAQYVVEHAADHRMRRLVTPPVQARGECVAEYHSFDQPLAVHEPFGRPSADDLR